MFPGGDLTIVLNGALSGSTGAFELVFPVESVAAVRKQLTDRGCHFTGEPREVAKGMWAAKLTDPDGHRLAAATFLPRDKRMRNDWGEIVGYGTHNGATRAFLLSPSNVVIRKPSICFPRFAVAGEESAPAEEDSDQ
jgi:hypothetical protein